jgi:hypothetical protein
LSGRGDKDVDVVQRYLKMKEKKNEKNSKKNRKNEKKRNDEKNKFRK